MKHLAGKVAFVTGGAGGIGLAMVRSFLRAGMKVAAADVEDAALIRVREEFAGNNCLLALKLDVTDRSEMARAADETEHTFGKVHVLCNNAGVLKLARSDALTYQDWDWVLGVNLGGVVNGLQVFLERIKKHGEGGHIVNTASLSGLIALQGIISYNASKYAVVGISETLRQELAPLGIGVSVLCPGMVTTNIGRSARNRPAALKADATAASAQPASVVARQLDDVFIRPLDPAVVGEMTLAAIRNDDAYIFTHPELRGQVAARFATIAAGFDRWKEYLG
jgi:NAD(P)-dependent dehydrogenase (short-subunit alcohol dehydrogenase family)